MNILFVRSLAIMAGLFPLAVHAGIPAEVEIFDRTAGQVLPTYVHDGERYIAGEPGHEYEIHIRNRSGRRLLAVTSVDGVNVVSGRTAATSQGGYVIDSRDGVEIDGWRKSLDEVAAFYFTPLPDSYAARTGRPDNVGVVGVALYREREVFAPMPPKLSRRDSAEDSVAGKAAPAAERLGTGHGQRHDSSARYTNFERVSAEPDAVIRIFYDSRRNLLAQGVIPPPRHARRLPDPFPGGFVADP